MPDEPMKRCSTCRTGKPLAAFHRSAKGANGVQGNCKDCNRRQARIQAWSKLGIVMTYEVYEARRVEQSGKCAICLQDPGERDLDVDHDHDTMLIRGLLCLDCNTGLGKFGDDPEQLRRALAYLAKYGKT